MKGARTKGGKTAAIVQARLGSNRLPLKSLLTLRGLPIIDWVIQRLHQARTLDSIIVAIPDTELDEALAQHLERGGIACVKGPEDDVLSRFCLAAKACEADLIVRVCADNPLIWCEAVDRLVEFYQGHDCDYAYNHIPKGNLWPDGLGAEIVSRDILDEMDKKASALSQREHCMNYIWDNPEKYRIATFDPVEDWLCRPDLKLDIDTEKDFLKLATKPLYPAMNAAEIARVFSGTE